MADNQKNLNIKLIDDTEQLLIEFKNDLIKLLTTTRELNIDSNTIKALKIEKNVSSKYVQLTGLDYIYYIIHGRGPGRFPPPNPATGEFDIPFPVAKDIAMFGNKAKYAPVANEFDRLYNEFIKKIKFQSGKTSLAYILRIGTLKTINI